VIRRALGAAGLIALVVGLSGSTASGSTTSTSGWTITSVSASGLTASGTFTNPNQMPVNAVSWGTEGAAKNPIVSGQFAGQDGKLYPSAGSVFFYNGTNVAPGQTVQWTTTATSSLGNPPMLQQCWSTDGGLDNQCNDVAYQASSTGSSTGDVKKQAIAVTAHFKTALTLEQKALLDIQLDEAKPAETAVRASFGQMDAVGLGKVDMDELPPATQDLLKGDATAARDADATVLHTFGLKHKPGARDEAELKKAIAAKKSAIATLRKFTR
jgi:hypothetical protein